MTLIISLISKRVVAHVSDTRLTYFDQITKQPIRYEDGKVKSIVIQGDGGCFLVSYCGLGKIEGMRTDLWLHDQLLNFNAGKREILDIANDLLKVLNEKIKPLNDFQRISVSISGFAITGQTSGVMQYLISNFEKCRDGKLVSEKVGEFDLCYLTPKARKPYSILINGADKATENKTFDKRMKKTIKLLRGWNDSKNKNLTSLLIELIGIANLDKLNGKYISKNCIITIIPASTWEPISTYYDSATGQKGIMPHIIGTNISYRDIEFSGGGEIKLQTNFSRKKK